ncbi:MAG: LacI family DNA-binding transcriptional regulator, partial [Thermomicrobiales bacterium]|nr:LacI family DNA-binding transcriptional regulator [Thermomicrobiales bacterium]
GAGMSHQGSRSEQPSLPTIRDVAREAGVGVGTVSRVIRQGGACHARSRGSGHRAAGLPPKPGGPGAVAPPHRDPGGGGAAGHARVLRGGAARD